MVDQIFTLPGLGFTPEVFGKLELPPGTKHLSWLTPRDEESLAAYAYRMAQPLADASAVTLIGHSFGGVLAQEIAAQLPVARVLLVSSVKSRAELPFWLRAAAPLRLHHLFRRDLTLRTFRFWARPAGYVEPADRELFRRMVATQDNRTLQWSLRELSRWRGVDCGSTVVHQIHGDRDRTLPFSRIASPVTRVAGGTHIMVFNRSEEVGRHLHDWLDIEDRLP